MKRVATIVGAVVVLAVFAWAGQSVWIGSLSGYQNVRQVTATSAGAGAGRTTKADSFQVADVNWRPNGIYGKIILSAPGTDKRGVGLVDSGAIRLFTKTYADPTSFLVAAVSKTDLPCTLSVSKSSSTAGNDTLLKPQYWIWVYVSDTTDDSAMTITYDVRYLLNLWDK